MQRILSWLRNLLKPKNDRTNPLDLLPDFENFSYTIAIEPVGSQLNAWTKLREAERRLDMYKWVEQHNDPATPQHRVLLNDSVSAFLLTFEATIQFMSDQFRRTPTCPRFRVWFDQQVQNDLYVRGLRTLRHFEAHVQSKPIPRMVTKHINSSNRDDVDCIWQLPKLTPPELKKLVQPPPLVDKDLPDWNTLVATIDAKTIFLGALYRLKGVLEIAEGVI